MAQTFKYYRITGISYKYLCVCLLYSFFFFCHIYLQTLFFLAVLGTDYDLDYVQAGVTITLQFPFSVIPGFIVSNNLAVMAIADSILEESETIDISVSQVSGLGGLTLPVPSEGVTLTIEDDEGEFMYSSTTILINRVQV